MTCALAPYTIHAIKYAHHSRKGSENLIHAGDLHDADMPLDFFVWALISEERTFVVDIGQEREDGVHFYIHPADESGETLDFLVKGNELTPL